MPTIARYEVQIDNALAAHDIIAAAQLAVQALTFGLKSPLILNLAAWQREEARDFEGARAILNDALLLSPNDLLLHLSIATVLRKAGAIRDSLTLLDTLEPFLADNVAFWLERAYANEADGMLDCAAADFELAHQLDLNSVVPLAGLAGVRSRQRRFGEARRHAARIHAVDQNNLAASLAIVRCDLAEGHVDQAKERLIVLLGRTEPVSLEQMTAQSLLGDAFDRMGSAPEAFAAYQVSKQTYLLLHGHQTFQQPSHTQFINRIASEIKATDDKFWLSRPQVSPPQCNPHIFLLGYPRSGNTLVETILVGIEGVKSLEERPTLFDADTRFLVKQEGIEELARLSLTDINDLRSAYWRRVEENCTELRSNAFIDMDPLKSLKLPIIGKLFPDAKILLMQRDPRDVVWSCFHTNFGFSAAATEFVTLGTTARHYAALMALIELCRSKMALNLLVVRYESLVSDFDEVTEQICQFIELPWHSGLRDFDRIAQKRAVRTASAGQVQRALYDGSGQWRRYAEYMQPVLPILKPWIEKFGYEVDR